MRYRYRMTPAKTFVAFSREVTPFASYELYCDTRFDQRNRERAILGISAVLG